MKATELIAQLQELVDEYGDVDVYANDGDGSPAYISNVSYESSHGFWNADGSKSYTAGLFIE